jgi:hypothetical protein
MIRSVVLAAVTALTLASCAGSEAAPGAVATAPAPVPPRAEQLAEALLLADSAEQRGDTAALAKAALMIDRLGPEAQTDSDAETLRRWRAVLPADAPPPLRGRALGPGYRSAVLMPGAATQLSQTFLGGRSARIVVKIAQGSALKLMVRDQAEREVCRADTDPVNCRWMPLYTQRHRIEIVNTGREVSRIYIVFD